SVVINGPDGQPVKTIKSTVRAFAKTNASGGGGVGGSIPVDSISTGPSTACALADGWAYCWGSDGSGLLGNGWNYVSDRSTIPVAIAKGSQPAQVSAPKNPCDSNLISAPPPCAGAKTSSIDSSRKIAKISVGTNHTCVVATDADGDNGQAHCWGRNDYGQLGTRNTNSSSVPVAVDTADYVPAEVSTGQCGRIFPPQRACRPAQPASALNGRTVTDITAGNGFTCALMDNRQVACWGRNDYGQLGNDGRGNLTYPTRVSYATSSRTECLQWVSGGRGKPDVCASSRVHNVSALVGKSVKTLGDVEGAATMCVTDIDDKAYCWGQNYAGQTGDGGSLPAAGNGQGHYSIQNTNQYYCGISHGSEAENQALDEIPNYQADRLRPVAVQTSLKFSKITTHSSNIDIKNIDVTNDTTGVNSYSIGVSSSDGANPYRAYYWGGEVKYTFTSNCSSTRISIGGDYYGSSRIEYIHDTDATANVVYTGKTTPTGPLYNDASGSTINRKPLVKSSGNAYNGLFCAATVGDIYCHGRGSIGREGQLGNGNSYANTCGRLSFGCH
ncbi:MAG: hypothetical protein WAW80_00005, partial [Candidatus Saccharimonadales bacterium]